MLGKNTNSVKIYTLENFSKKQGIIHFFSGRTGGTSPPPFNSLNLSFSVTDAQENVIKNRKILSASIGVPLENFIFMKQGHSNRITQVSAKMKGKGALDYKTAINNCDGMITNEKNIMLVVLSGDCTPILFYNQKQKIIGVVHAGWRGTVKKISSKMVEILSTKFKCAPSEIYVAIGPSIGPCCYEVGKDVVEIVHKCFPQPENYLIFKSEKYFFDLWTGNQTQLISAGIPENNIEIAKICTKCHNDLFFSARATGGLTGRFAGGIMLTF